ncbi:AAA family ATPase [Bacillus cereus]
MKISINNIGHVKHAEIEVNSITVIAGNNNTGKSTVGKALYAIATGLDLMDPYSIIQEKAESINRQLQAIYSLIELDNNQRTLLLEIEKQNKPHLYLEGLHTGSLEEIDTNYSQQMLNYINDFFLSFNSHTPIAKNSILNRVKSEIERLLNTPIDDKNFKLNIMQKVFSAEFFQQISNLNHPNLISSICVKEVNQPEINLLFENHQILDTGTNLDTNRPFSKAIYIDNPFILDDEKSSIFISSSNRYIHSMALKTILFPKFQWKNQNLFELNNTEHKIDDIFKYVMNKGKPVRKEGRHYFESADIKTPLAFENISTGLKSFSILYILLTSQGLINCEYIILDEPEIHLHPDWQLKYAELVVLMSKEFNLKIIITSHSPYFIEAIEIFSKKHNYFDDVKFYKTQLCEETDGFIIKDTTKNISDLYDDLAAALYELENIRDAIEDGENFGNDR